MRFTRAEISGIAMAAPTPHSHRRPRRKREPALNLPLDRLGFIIVKAREYDVKEADSDPDEGSNPIDDGQADVLAEGHDDPVGEELLGAINALNEEERIRLVALAWLGRGTYSKEEWKEAVETARNQHSRRAGEYLLGLPLLGDYLEDGLAMFEEGIVDDDDARDDVEEQK
jgi:hypothetical protein